MMNEKVEEFLASGGLPNEGLDAIGWLKESGGMFLSQEGPTWDFKQEWPFSYSDNYFLGIARLIAAFANTRGGIIVFGVHDKKRTAGHNRVSPNLDRLEQALDQLLTEHVELLFRRYFTDTDDAVDVLLVPPHSSESMPVKFKIDVEKYQKGIIWIREGHEVLAAEPRHIPMLYCRSTNPNSDSNDEVPLGSTLPPSPATVKRFVGRLSTIDFVFRWLKNSDEPRLFLHGKGGSGKTTIAYEVAKTISSYGGRFQIYGGEKLDSVMFISAKQITLNTLSGQQETFVGKDFSNEHELYQAILTQGKWTSGSIAELSLDQIRKEIKEFFDLTSNLVIIDDIDTLTTKGVEAGFDFLYGMCWRSRRRSKLLYTLRNAPTQSLANAIEIPGLKEGSEYEEFVDVCARQFEVEKPTLKFVSTQLSNVSERRPLVVESIIALRRHSGNYERAIQLFEQNSGDDVRKYVFQREWDSLPADNHARYTLAIIALNGGPVSFADLTALTRYDEGRVKDALAAIREMFLNVSDAGSETIYTMGALTSAFVLEAAQKLDHYSALRARVERWRSNIYPENPILTRLRDRVEGLVEKALHFLDDDLLRQAWSMIIDPTLSPRIIEDPRFMALQGFVAAKQNPPRLSDARRFFANAFAMKFEPESRYLKAWYFAERDSGHGHEECLKIADFVTDGKRYSDREKLYFLIRKATSLFTHGKADRFAASEKAITSLSKALLIHLQCHSRFLQTGEAELERAEEYARNTAFTLFDFLIQSDGLEEFFRVIDELSAPKKLAVAVIREPLVRAFGLLAQKGGAAGDLQKLKNKILDARRQLDACPASAPIKSEIHAAATAASIMISQRLSRRVSI